MLQGRILDTIKHYQNFPCFKPWVGDKYLSQSHKRLLVIGESHYLPPDSTIHLDAEKWYERQQSDLSAEEVKWLSTSGIIKKNKDRNFPKKAHGIYRNACAAINSCSFNYTPSSKVIENFAYYNFFQRPAEVAGNSIKINKIDKAVSLSVFQSILEKLSPELIIFTSSLAGTIGRVVASNSEIPYVVTPHPTSPWWNRTARKYHGKGRDLVPAFLIKHEWKA
jgi:hypothetical protein